MKTKDPLGCLVALLGVLFPFLCCAQQEGENKEALLKDNSTAITESEIRTDISGVKYVAFLEAFPDKFIDTEPREDIDVPPFLSMKNEIAAQKGKTPLVMR